MAVDQEQEDAFISGYMGATGIEDIAEIIEVAKNHDWVLAPALQEWSEQQAKKESDAMDEDADADNAPENQASNDNAAYTGPRTLSGAPAPESQRPVKSKPAKKKTGVATLSSIGGSSSHQHDHDDDDDDDDDDDGRGDLYAGGEKSGLSVQDPSTGQGPSGHKKIIKDIIAKAKRTARQEHDHDDDDEEQAGPSRSQFRGEGQKLGNEGDAPTSAEAATPGEPESSPAEPPQERTLHLWQNGFSIDDGELRRFDDPENARELQMIQHGRAPLHLMNLRIDQAVNVVVSQHDEDYRQTARVYRSFAGEGRRLGSPVPGAESGAGAASIAQTVAASAPAASSASTATTSNVDESQPTLTIRIQLPDGTRLPARFNTAQTISDVYDFVQRASPATQARAWVLATTFPNKDHNDKGLVLGEMPEFKRGGTAVVKWA